MFCCNTKFYDELFNTMACYLFYVTYIIIPTCSDECLMLPHLNYTILLLLTLEMEKII